MKVVQDIWHGDSRVLCQRLKPNSVGCVITDPPFGVDNQSHSSVTVEGKMNARKIANDESPEQAISVFNEVMDVLLPKTKEHADLYIFTAHQVLNEWLDVADSLSRHGYTRRGILVWEKTGPGMGDTDSWGMSHEFCIFLKKGRRLRSDTRRSGVIHIPQVRPDKLIHPHEKPLALIELLLKHSTSPGDLAVDPFGGSGTLARACKNIGRSGLSMEYDKLNFDRAYEALHSADGLF
jgi:site-specific DNA-methyltransferase (adenine-specific)